MNWNEFRLDPAVVVFTVVVVVVVDVVVVPVFVVVVVVIVVVDVVVVVVEVVVVVVVGRAMCPLHKSVEQHVTIVMSEPLMWLDATQLVWQPRDNVAPNIDAVYIIWQIIEVIVVQIFRIFSKFGLIRVQNLKHLKVIVWDFSISTATIINFWK